MNIQHQPRSCQLEDIKKHPRVDSESFAVMTPCLLSVHWKEPFPESHPAAPSKGRIVPFLLQVALEDPGGQSPVPNHFTNE